MIWVWLYLFGALGTAYIIQTRSKWHTKISDFILTDLSACLLWPAFWIFFGCLYLFVYRSRIYNETRNE